MEEALKAADGTAAVSAALCSSNAFDLMGFALEPVDGNTVKRRYYKLALLLHPDKNSHPSAETAFKAMSKAFEELSDPSAQASSLSRAVRRDGCGDGGGGGGGDGGSDMQTSAGKRGRPNATDEAHSHKTKRGFGSPGKRKREKSYADILREFEAMEKEWGAANERRLRTNKGRQNRKREHRDQESQRLASQHEDLVARLAVNADSHAASWRSYAGKAAKAAKMDNGQIGGGRGDSGGGSDGGNGNAVERERESEGDNPAKFAAGGEGAGRWSAVDSAAAGPAAATAATSAGLASVEFPCWLCRRKFRSAQKLALHKTESELHKRNAQAEREATAAAALAPGAKGEAKVS